MNKNFISTFTWSAIFVAAAGVVSRSTGFVREIIFAGYFGAGENFDIYLTGTILPFIINTSIFYIAQNYLIPLYNSRAENKIEQKEIIRNNLLLFFTSALLITIILFFVKGIIINSYLWNSPLRIKELTENIFAISVLTIPFYAGYSVLASYLQARKNFKYPAVFPIIQNLIVFLTVIFGYKNLGIYSIPIGYLTGYILQFFILLFKYEDKKELLSSYNTNKPTLNINTFLIIIVLIEVINQLYSFTDRYFINYLSPGKIAALNYSFVLFNLPVNIISYSFAIVAFPLFSELVSQNNFEILKKYFYKLIVVVFIIFIPISIVFFNYGSEIISIIFQRGSFTTNNTETAFKALKMYTISLAFLGAYSIIYKMMFSLGLSKLLLILTAAHFIIKISLNFILVNSIGFSGLALSTSISYILISSICFIIISRELNKKYNPVTNNVHIE